MIDKFCSIFFQCLLLQLPFFFIAAELLDMSIIEEIYESERAYVRDLKVLQSVT